MLDNGELKLWASMQYVSCIVGISFKGNGNTFKGSNSVQLFLPVFWKMVYSKRKEFAPYGSKFFSFTVDPFPEGAWSAGKQTVSHKSCHPCKIWLLKGNVYTWGFCYNFQRETTSANGKHTLKWFKQGSKYFNFRVRKELNILKNYFLWRCIQYTR